VKASLIERYQPAGPGDGATWTLDRDIVLADA